MKARRKGIDNPFEDIDMVQLKGTDILYKANVMEFEHDSLSTELKTYDQIEEEKHWTDVREKAAIAAMQGILSSWTIDYGEPSTKYITKTAVTEYITKTAVELADAFVEQLKSK